MEDSTSDGLAVDIDLTTPIRDATSKLKTAQYNATSAIASRDKMIADFAKVTEGHNQALEMAERSIRSWEREAAIWQEALDRLNGPTLFDDEVRKLYGPAPDEE